MGASLDAASVIARLHDAPLYSVAFDWAARTVRLRLAAFLGPHGEATRIELILREVRLLHCPRREPWGASVFIHEARLGWAADAAHRLEIEMQSGDVLTIEGGEITAEAVERAAEGPGSA